MATLNPIEEIRIAPAIARHVSAMLPIMERLFHLHLRADDPAAAPPAARIIEALAPTHAPQSGAPVPTLVLAPVPPDRAILKSAGIRFTDDPQVPWPFRGRFVAVDAELDAATHATLKDAGGAVLATDADGLPLWTVQGDGASAVHRTSLRLPHAPSGSDAGLAASGARFVQVLPLFHFLHANADGRGMRDPPLRASYIIDDPNLHWPTYGYADYRDIAEGARRDHYHVAFATIPVDGWWVHAATAEILRANSDTLSLLIHGNNHAKEELAQDFSQAQCAALLRQAIVRIEGLELKAGLPVSRVMVPPHGACSARMLAEMPRQGFESACISAGSLRAHNPGHAWTRSLGFASSEVVEGCPVLPRWPFAGTSEAVLLTAAYLGQPLILRGHHQDLKGGLDVLQIFAGMINSLGDVHWGSLGDMSRLNFRHRIDGSLLWVEPLGTTLAVRIPDGVDELRIESAGSAWRAMGADMRTEPGSDDLIVGVRPGSTVSLARCPPQDSGGAPARTFPTSPRLIVRRILTETRDRLRVE